MSSNKTRHQIDLFEALKTRRESEDFSRWADEQNDVGNREGHEIKETTNSFKTA